MSSIEESLGVNQNQCTLCLVVRNYTEISKTKTVGKRSSKGSFPITLFIRSLRSYNKH